MFKRKHDRERDKHIIANLEAQVESLHAQLVAATVEFERRYDEMKRDRDLVR